MVGAASGMEGWTGGFPPPACLAVFPFPGLSPYPPNLHSEFMVEEHELQKEKIQEDYNDKYWDQRYTIVQQQIPSFLQKVADKILSTGKNGKPPASEKNILMNFRVSFGWVWQSPPS